MSYFPEQEFIANETNTVIEYLTNNGSENQAVDGSVTPVVFSSTVVPAGKVFIASRIMIYMESSGAMDSDKFGDIPTANMGDGWQLVINGVVKAVAKHNRGLVINMFDAHGSEIFGKLDRTLIGRFSFSSFTNGVDGITITAGNTLDTIVAANLISLTFLEVLV